MKAVGAAVEPAAKCAVESAVERAAKPVVLSGNSRVVSSGQTGPHADLGRVLRRHFEHPFRQPVGDAARVAWASLRACWNGVMPLVFDSGCGVGDSTRRLALMHPDALVVGVDQSADRLSRQRPEPLPANAMLLRADLVDFWRLAVADGVQLTHHYLLYPNPWPKIGHLKRRWHGHPVFPALLALGGRIELRTNWATYAEEFAQALVVAQAAGGSPKSGNSGDNSGCNSGGNSGFELTFKAGHESGAAPGRFFWKLCTDTVSVAELLDPLTPFERKYAASGQTLHRVVAEPYA